MATQSGRLFAPSVLFIGRYDILHPRSPRLNVASKIRQTDERSTMNKLIPLHQSQIAALSGIHCCKMGLIGSCPAIKNVSLELLRSSENRPTLVLATKRAAGIRNCLLSGAGFASRLSDLPVTVRLAITAACPQTRGVAEYVKTDGTTRRTCFRGPQTAREEFSCSAGCRFRPPSHH